MIHRLRIALGLAARKVLGYRRPSVRLADRLVPEALAWFRLSQEEAIHRQLEWLRLLLQEAQTHVPYYRELLGGCHLDGQCLKAVVQSIPPLSRVVVQSRPHELCTDRRGIRLHENASGGSSGFPVIIYQSEYGQAISDASRIAADMIAGYRPGGSLAALWGGSSERRLAKVGIKRAANWCLNYTLYDSFNMDEGRMEQYHRKLSRQLPDVLLCYASSLHIFARFLESQRLKPKYPRRGLIASAEMLTPEMRQDITRVFSAPLFNRYGSRETGIIAMECEQHDGLHVVGNNCLIEVVHPDTYLSVPDGDVGEVLVTTLREYGMPLIRYRIGDMAVLTATPCPCGRPGPRLTRIVGRTSDSIRLASGRLVHGEYFTHLLYGIRGVRQFRFVQESIRNYLLMLVTDEHYEPSHDDTLVRELRTLLGEGPEIRIQHVNQLDPLPSGKLQFVLSKLRDSVHNPADRVEAL